MKNWRRRIVYLVIAAGLLALLAYGFRPQPINVDTAIAARGALRVTVEEEGRTFVFLHTAPESFERREVVLGVRDGAWRAVRQGLKEGERVVVRGVATLQATRGGR